MKKQLQVIMVDDDTVDQQIFSEALKEALPDVNYSAISKGKELYSFFETKIIPDLFFLDWSVHCELEESCLELIKHQEHLKEVPVIIYSGLESEEEIKKFYDKGAALFVSKPSSYDELKEILKTLLTLKWDKIELENAKNSLLKEFKAIRIPE